jgi:hypothetical protein
MEIIYYVSASKNVLLSLQSFDRLKIILPGQKSLMVYSDKKKKRYEIKMGDMKKCINFP